MPVSYQDTQKNLSLVVVKGERPCLFGRDWLSNIKLDWNSIYKEHQIHKVDNRSPVDEMLSGDYPDYFKQLLKQYEGLFSKKGFGIKDFTAQIKVAEGASPSWGFTKFPKRSTNSILNCSGCRSRV